MYQVIFILLTYIIRITGYISADVTEKAYCNRLESYINHEGKIGYYNKTICCLNYENLTGKCKPCEEGFSSKNSSCKPCSTHFYGRRCSKQCNCNESHRCDHVIGCVEIINNTTYKKDGSTETGTYVSSTRHVEYTTQTNEGIETGDAGCSPTEFFLYFISGAFAVIPCLSFLYICYCKMRSTNQQITSDNNMHIVEYSNQYELIDESNLIDANLSTVERMDHHPPNATVPRSSIEVIQFPSDEHGVDEGDDVRDRNIFHTDALTTRYTNSTSTEISNEVNRISFISCNETDLNETDCNRESHHRTEPDLNSYLELEVENKDIHVYQRAIPRDRTNVKNTEHRTSMSYENLRIWDAQ